jgi:hypothetical protein
LACPQCHLEIPPAFLEINPTFISIVGVPISGKSCFLAAMTWELKQKLKATFGLTFTDVDVVGNRTINEYEELLFLREPKDELQAIKKTELGGDLYRPVVLNGQRIALPLPFVFLLRPGREHRPDDVDMARLICLYDNAGEHFLPGKDTASEPGTQHLAHSGVILFLFDPTQDPRFREECLRTSNDPQLHKATAVLRQDIALTDAATRIRRHKGLSARKKIEKPLIILVGKSDVWEALLPQTNIRTEPFIDREGAGATLDIPRVDEVSSLVRGLLIRLTPEFVTAAEEACREVVYIPVSAFGHSAEQLGNGYFGIRPRDIAPRWVTVPILYSLARWSTRSLQI